MPMNNELIQKSRFLSKILRHRPDAIGVRINSSGWASIDDLLTMSAARGILITATELHSIVECNDKSRFELSSDCTKIRAVQGHSIPIKQFFKTKKPPSILFHGTIETHLPAIRKIGLVPGTRHDVHLSVSRETAAEVASRRGVPIILEIATYPMVISGVEFKQAENGVWLVASVKPEFIRFPYPLK